MTPEGRLLPSCVENRSAAPSALALVAALLLTPVPAATQGFGIYEQGTCAMGRAGAAVAAPCGDASSVFFNPAALQGIDDPTVTLGLTGIVTDGTFTPDDGGEATTLATRTIPIPHLFLGFEPTPEWGLGVGVYAPYGLETTWPTDFEGRYVGYDNALRTVYVQPTASWRPADGVALGAGVTAVWSEVSIRRRQDLATTPVPPGLGTPAGATFGDLGVPTGTDFVDVALEGDSDGVGLGFHAGVLVDLTDDLRFGLRYLSAVDVDYDGAADFEAVDPGVTLGAGNPFGVPAGTPLALVLENAGVYADGGPLADRGVTTGITMPAQLVAGLALDVTPALTLSADLQHTRWNAFDTVRIAFEGDAAPDEILEEGYEDTNTVRIGLEWANSDALTLRGGYVWNEAAAPDRTVTPLLPEASRHTGTAGVGLAVHGVQADLAYMYIAQEDRRGRVRNPPPGEASSAEMNTGAYAFNGHLLGLTLSMDF